MRSWMAAASALVVLSCLTGAVCAASGNGPIADQAPESKAVFELHGIHALMGKEVRSSKGEAMGRIVNILIDDTGAPRAAVIDFGGFLGVGVRKIAVDWNALEFSLHGATERVTVNLTRDQVKAAPEYKDGQQSVIVTGVSTAAPPTP